MKLSQRTIKCRSMDSSIEGVLEKNNTPKIMRRRANLKINIVKSSFVAPEKTYDIEDDYEILETLGVGAYSIVKSAIDKNTKNKVAIKICRGTNSVEMLRKEYEILKDINHECIIKVQEFTKDGVSEAYLVMEYFEGVTLDKYIQNNSSISEEQAKEIMRKLIEVLSYLHSEGITHCDIKPENVLVSDCLNIKLIDFNTSISSKHSNLRLNEDFIDIECLSASSSDSKFSQSHLSCTSSPLYASPETQTSSNGRLSESMDIWGAGVVLFSMLVGTLTSYKLDEISDINERQSKILRLINEHTNLSLESNQFLSELLVKNSEARPTAQQALQSSWFKAD